MRRFAFSLLVVAFTAPTAIAQRPITLEEAVTLAQRNAPQAVQAQGQARTSAAALRSAYGAFLPNVTLSAGANRQIPSGGTTRFENGEIITVADEPWSSSLGLGANVELFDGGRRIFDVRQARARKTAAEVNEVTQRFGVALTAKQRFFDVLAARESQAAAAAQLEQAEQQRRVSVARTRAKAATRSDSLRAEIQVRNAQLAVLEARNALQTADASLTRAVGSPEPVTADAADSLDRPTLALDEAALRALAQNGPLVQGADAELDAARAAASAAWTDYLPSVTASYSRSGSGVGESPTLAGDNFAYSGAFRLSLSFPLFNQFQRESQVVQAQVARQNADAALRDTRLAALESLTQAHGGFQSAAERVASQTATVAAAEEDLRVQQQRYAVGGSTLLDVLTSQTQLDQARRDLIRARYDQRVAKAQLEALVGRDL
ncbi:MAG TPA: TolC family protein [Candidatus Limnocylindria bacterium]|nr:TolC family protein [Candidatus Limnocylindria bacterium]